MWEYKVYQNQAAFDNREVLEQEDGYSKETSCRQMAIMIVDHLTKTHPELVKTDMIVKVQTHDREEINTYRVLESGQLQAME